VSSNRIRVRLACDDLCSEELEVTLEEQSGYIVAGVLRPGFVMQLPEASEARRLFENALAGLYQLAEVDLVREHIAYELGEDTSYDVADDGLVVWPHADFRTELVYSLDTREQRTLLPKVKGEPLETTPAPLDTRHLLYREQAIPWVSWVATWSAADREGIRLPRLLRGVPILPSAAAPSDLRAPPPRLEAVQHPS